MNTITTRRNPYIAAVLNTILGGVGYIYVGQTVKGIMFIGLFTLLACGFYPLSITLMLFAIIDAFFIVKRSGSQNIGEWDFFWNYKDGYRLPTNKIETHSKRDNVQSRSVTEDLPSAPFVQLPYAERQWIIVTDDTSVKVEGPGVHILPVPRNETLDIDFPPGHPRGKVVYVGHPTVANLYYPVAQFHRLTLEHKFAESIRLLVSLGASQVEVEHVTGWSRELGIDFTIPLDVKSGFQAENTSSSTNRLLFKATLNGSKEAHLPEDLTWYQHEPTWQRVADARMKYGLQTFSLDLRYEDDFGVNANFKSVVEMLGFDLGGKFEDHKSTVWRIVGSFDNVQK